MGGGGGGGGGGGEEEGYTGHNIPKTYPLITSAIVAMIGAMYISISITHLVFTYPFKFHYL